MHMHILSFVEALPTTVSFKEAYQQVRKEEEAVLVCVVREMNLHRKDTVTVVSLLQGEEENLASACEKCS